MNITIQHETQHEHLSHIIHQLNICDIINDMSLFKTFNMQYIHVISNNCNNNIIIKIICDAKHTFRML
jgi:hypothetical protein